MEYWQIICLLLGATYGGTLSILSGIKTTRFEELDNAPYYLALGSERLFFSYIAGAIAFVLLKTEVIFPKLDHSNYWALILVSAIAGFSEAFVPGILEKVSSNKGITNEASGHTKGAR